MAEPGFFDLANPLFDLIQGGLSLVLPDWLSISLWALLASVVSMKIYGVSSNQDELSEIEPARNEARRALAVYDGPFEGLLPLIKQNLSLSVRHLWLTMIPAILASVPVLFVLVWMSNAFGAYFPSAGTPVSVIVDSYTPYELEWQGNAVVEPTGVGRWTIEWPAQGDRLVLLGRSGEVAASLPPEAPSVIVHKKLWWNDLIGNPAGYLDPGGNLKELHLGLSEPEIIPLGPSWLRNWTALFLLELVAFSLFFKWRWQLK